MITNHLIDQKLSGILSVLDAAPASELHHSVSQQYAENYNAARVAVIATNPDLMLAPPALDINPDGRVEATYLEVKTYVSELHTFVYNKLNAERVAFRERNPPKVIRDNFRR